MHRVIETVGVERLVPHLLASRRPSSRVPGQRPSKVGDRFSMKAVSASRVSWVAKLVA